MAAEALDEIATLIGEIGRCYQRGRRYRAIAAVCEERYLARALEIGSRVRRARRVGDLDAPAAASLIATLRELQAECERAIAAELFDVSRLKRMIVIASPPAAATVSSQRVLPPPRHLRPAKHYALVPLSSVSANEEGGAR